MSREIEYHILKGHTASVNALAFFASDSKVISTGDDNILCGWSIKDKSCDFKLRGHDAPIKSCTACRHSNRIVSGSWDRTAKLWDGEKKQCLWTFQLNSMVLHVCLDETATKLSVCCDDKTTTIFDLNSYQEIATITGHACSVTCSNILGNTLATGSMDKTVRVSDLRTNTCLLKLTGHQGVVSSVNFSLDHFKLASASWDKTIRVWDLHAGTFRSQGPKVMYEHEGCVSSCEFVCDNKKIVSAGFDKQVIIWDAMQYKQNHKIRAHGSWINDARMSQDGTWLATASKDRTIRLWNVADTDKLPVVLYNKLEMGYKFKECDSCSTTFKVEETDLIEVGEAITKCVYCRMRMKETLRSESSELTI